MKHSCLKSLFAMLLLLCTTVANAYDFEADGIYYNVTDTVNKTVKVVSGSPKYTGSVVIPARVAYNGTTYDVTGIGNFAFNACFGLTDVVIPDGIISIGTKAFAYCSDLTDVVIPNSVTIIRDSAFEYCTGLINATVGNGVTSIGKHAFARCDRLVRVTLGNGLVKIGNNAFSVCKELESIVIPNSVTDIGKYAFSGCSSLESAIIGDGVVNIGDEAFRGCSSLKSITIPNSVTEIGVSAFEGCLGLKDLIIGNGIKELWYDVFEGCSGLESITSLIPADKLFQIDRWMFEGVDKSTCILYVPYGAKSKYMSTIYWSDFVNIEELEEITNVDEVSDVVIGNNKTIYDLNGRVVEDPASGLYILNGKKVLLK